MIQKDDIRKIFKDYDKRVIDFLELIVVGLDGQIHDFMLTNLQLLAVQLMIYFKALDEVKNSDLTMVTQKGPKQAPCLDVLQKAHARILELLKECGITKASKTRINRMQRSDDTGDTETLIEMLTA